MYFIRFRITKVQHLFAFCTDMRGLVEQGK